MSEEKFSAILLSNKVIEFAQLFNLDPQLFADNLINTYTIFPELTKNKKSQKNSIFDIPFKDNIEIDEQIELNFLKVFLNISQMTYKQNSDYQEDEEDAISQITKQNQKSFNCEHFIEIESIRGLFTKRIKEFIEFYIDQISKITSIDAEKKAALKWIGFVEGRTPSKVPLMKNVGFWNNPGSAKIKKEILLMAVIDFPQVNIQNELANSQSLFASKEKIEIYLIRQVKKTKKKVETIQIDINSVIHYIEVFYAPNDIQKESDALWILNKDFRRPSFTSENPTNLKEDLLITILSGKNIQLSYHYVICPKFFDLRKPKNEIILEVRLFRLEKSREV